MVVFPWGAIVASNMAASRRARERREVEEAERLEREEQERRAKPFKNEVLEGFQIYIYPVYGRDSIETLGAEENGQLNLFKKDYIPVDIIMNYYVNDGWNTALELDKFFKVDE